MTGEGLLDMDHLASLIGERTRMVAVVHASNVLGTINPVTRIAEMAHAADALCLIDATQSVPHMPVDFAALGVTSWPRRATRCSARPESGSWRRGPRCWRRWSPSSAVAR